MCLVGTWTIAADPVFCSVSHRVLWAPGIYITCPPWLQRWGAGASVRVARSSQTTPLHFILFGGTGLFPTTIPNLSSPSTISSFTSSEPPVCVVFLLLAVYFMAVDCCPSVPFLLFVTPLLARPGLPTPPLAFSAGVVGCAAVGGKGDPEMLRICEVGSNMEVDCWVGVCGSIPPPMVSSNVSSSTIFGADGHPCSLQLSPRDQQRDWPCVYMGPAWLHSILHSSYCGFWYSGALAPFGRLRPVPPGSEGTLLARLCAASRKASG